MAEPTSIDGLLAEGQRQIAICNGCRYCEGYCAVFPAMERLPVVGAGDLTYLANLCHDCRACYQACMYAPPHPFGVEIPKLMSEARERSYSEFARPRWFARWFTAGPRAVAALTLAGALVFAFLAWAAGRARGIFAPTESTRTFFDVIPYGLMLVPSLLLTAFLLAVIVWGFIDFQRASRGASHLGARVWLSGLAEVATLRWMRGGGDDCYYPAIERSSPLRRRFHHLTAYGFLAALVSTSLASFYHNVLDLPAPYPVLHPVVLFGLVGGIGMTVGTTGLLWLKARAAPLQARREALLNSSFLVSLNLASTSGLFLLALRDTPAMGALLVLHLGTIVALYVTAPYGKFVHIVYRTAAVLRSAAERAADEAAGGRSAREPAALGRPASTRLP
ncbi:MAG: tricarballylate utilization 4Fe-4S protein TcuB [Actinomycetota bacterium]